jgi:hypothetical protein
MITQESIMQHLVLWKIAAGLLFVFTLCLFGNLPWTIFSSLRKIENNKWLRYLYSTIGLFMLFMAIRVLNEVFNIFSHFMNAK